MHGSAPPPRARRLRSAATAAVVLSLAFLGGCAAPPPRTPGQPAPSAAKEHVIEVAPIVVSPLSDAELAATFEKGRKLLLDGDYAHAAEIFDRLPRLSPTGEVAAPSLYNAAIAHEGLGERDVALARYREFLQRFPDHPLAKSALLRELRALAYLERWPEIVPVADQILARGDLVLLDQIEAHGEKALGLVEQDQVDAAAREVDVAETMMEDARLGESGKPPVELAAVSFALGEVRRKRGEAITFVPVPANFAEVLEQRCTKLLDAQAAYTDAMRSLDAHWSAMAGYRVGQLYQQLHSDVMRIPPPPNATTLRQKQLFEGAMRLRYRILLEKGLKLMDATVRIGERTGESSAWIARARDAKRDLERAIEDEKVALSKLPFSEQELQAALDDLKKTSK